MLFVDKNVLLVVLVLCFLFINISQTNGVKVNHCQTFVARHLVGHDCDNCRISEIKHH
jgi:hypothetical protein